MNLKIKFLNAMQIIIKVRMSDKVNRLRCHLGHEKEYDDNVITTSEIIFNWSLRKLRCQYHKAIKPEQGIIDSFSFVMRMF